MSQQITDQWEDIDKTHETGRRFAAYVVFGLSMGFLFGMLVDSVFVGVLFAVAVGSLPVIRSDFHRRATIARETACAEREDTSEPNIWRSAIILPTSYGADAAFRSVKRADALVDQVDVQRSPPSVRIPKSITDLERRTPSEGDTVH